MIDNSKIASIQNDDESPSRKFTGLTNLNIPTRNIVSRRDKKGPQNLAKVGLRTKSGGNAKNAYELQNPRVVAHQRRSGLNF